MKNKQITDLGQQSLSELLQFTDQQFTENKIRWKHRILSAYHELLLSINNVNVLNQLVKGIFKVTRSIMVINSLKKEKALTHSVYIMTNLNF